MASRVSNLRESPLSGKRIAFVGCGVMAEAIAAALLRAGLVSVHQLTGGEPNARRRQELIARLGLETTPDNVAAVRGADLVVLSVKPQTLEAAMRDLAGVLAPEQIVLSIVAGATVRRLQEGLQHERVVRSMPNTPAQIGHGATVWYPAPGVTPQDEQLVRTVLEAMGLAIRVDNEDMVDMATALSGTGPAYVFLIMEALIDAGVHLGFSRNIAEQLVQQTILGSVLFARETGKHPAELRNMVTTPGGTSAAALYEMERGGLRTVIARAVWAAYRRAKELGAGMPNGGPSDL
ncbi:pyrroline-5-carboxylate reductase [Thermomicrobium sp. 4228-Ro]|uniref:pyrroline-5-carboxylate reductase n=1 Tax=Thermomicrobium sp. 4228-Ro TaxID=2993937 RepID=UPI0022491E6B|nr:pyrroline-5-carboxylate reductase [Thermomicrobium sp. 4228-Ro]MCX2727873.1 pyrroline-5-carboxylate reductase [Thermomicrobium sp. 4228-Ro]